MFSKLKNFIKNKYENQENPESIKQKNSNLDNTQQNNVIPPSEPVKDVPDFQPDTIKKHKYTRKGIRKIENDQEMLDHFNLDSEKAYKNSEKNHQLSKTPKKQVVRSKERKTDKHGFPVIESSDDLFKMMASVEQSDISDTISNDCLSSRQAPPQHALKDRHGIPILNSNKDYKSFLDAADEDPENFAEILARSLGEKTSEVLLREKRDQMDNRKPLTLKKTLSRYPLPQGQLDLHGYTSMKADMKTDSYLKNAFYKGTYTVRIIVGKGLHSEAGAVLPDVVEERINRLKREKIVLSYEWDNKKKWKSGALTVYLNNFYQHDNINS